jgi:hypothetical protein
MPSKPFDPKQAVSYRAVALALWQKLDSYSNDVAPRRLLWPKYVSPV